MWVFLIVGLLSAAVLVLKLFTGHIGDIADIALLLAFITTSFGMFVFGRVNERHDTSFLRWLVHNSHDVLANGAEYRGRWIDGSTPLVRYWGASSFILMSTQWQSRLYFEDEPQDVVRNACSVISALLGLWGLPWGPIFTYRALKWNFGGGERLTARALYHEVLASRAE